MLQFASMPKTCRKIRRPDENSVDARHGRNCFDLFHSFPRLNLHEHAKLVRRTLRIIRNPPKLRRPCNTRHAANAIWRIARRRHRSLGLGSVLHIRDQKGLCAVIEKPLDKHRIVDRRPHHAMHGIRGGALQLLQRR